MQLSYGSAMRTASRLRHCRRASAPTTFAAAAHTQPAAGSSQPKSAAPKPKSAAPKSAAPKDRRRQPQRFQRPKPVDEADLPPSVIAARAAELEDERGVATPKVVLKPDKVRLFTGGCPLVYSGAVDSVIGRPPPSTGDVVTVATASRHVIGWGTYNTSSMFRVRILQTDSEAAATGTALDVAATIRSSVAAAAQMRRALGLPSGSTNVYRLVNSEADRLSGLTVDVLAGHAVVQAGAAWVQRYKAGVLAAVQEVLGPQQQVLWRPAVERLRDDGWEGEVDVEGEDPDLLVEVVENGVKFVAHPWGQKTGFYADQRDSRALIAAAAAAGGGTGTGGAGGGKEVLDLCCYTGGFAIQAAVAGASCTGVDSSQPAIDMARRSADLNGVGERCEFVRGEVEPFMREAAQAGRQWDIVVLDPPKLAPNRKALEGAAGKYKALNRAALQLVKPGGLLMTCSCSGAVTQTDSLPAYVAEAAAKAGRRVRLLRHAGAGTDHPVDPTYPEGRYLTNLLYFVQ